MDVDSDEFVWKNCEWCEYWLPEMPSAKVGACVYMPIAVEGKQGFDYCSKWSVLSGKASCLGCRYWDQFETNLKYGVCRVNPPERDDVGDGVWPTVEGHSWCGRFEANGE